MSYLSPRINRYKFLAERQTEADGFMAILTALVDVIGPDASCEAFREPGFITIATNIKQATLHHIAFLIPNGETIHQTLAPEAKFSGNRITGTIAKDWPSRLLELANELAEENDNDD